MPRITVTLEQDGERFTRRIVAPSISEAKQFAVRDYPDAKIVEIGDQGGSSDSDGGASHAVSHARDSDPRSSVLDARMPQDQLGPVLYVLGLIVVVVSIVGGFVAAYRLPGHAGSEVTLGVMLSVWAYSVVGLLIMGVGRIVTYLYRIQAMMIRNRE